MGLFRNRRPDAVSAQRIYDPQAHAALTDPGPFEVLDTCNPWASWACHYTTVRDFGTVDGIDYYNNCGPTALTNLVCTVMNRQPIRATGTDPRALYSHIAKYGVRHLFFINSKNRLFHGSSDLRAGTWVRRMCKAILGLRPKLRLHTMRIRPLQRAFQAGDLAYLMLWRHPLYHSHHLLGYGYITLRSRSTGRIKTYLQVSDGQSPALRYLDLDACRGLFYSVRFDHAKTATASDLCSAHLPDANQNSTQGGRTHEA